MQEDLNSHGDVLTFRKSSRGILAKEWAEILVSLVIQHSLMRRISLLGDGVLLNLLVSLLYIHFFYLLEGLKTIDMNTGRNYIFLQKLGLLCGW